VEAYHRGNVKLSDSLHIHDVLYLPAFAVNLIPVSKMCKEQDCIVNFEANLCIIQEKKDMRKIGLAEERDGLYYLKAEKKTEKTKQAKISSISISNNKSTSAVPLGILWHLRLGHLSHDRIQCMNKLYSYISVSDHIACDICQISRQRKLPFCISKNNAHAMFDLVHVDIWGPFSTDFVHGFRYFLTILDDYSRHVWVVMMKTKSEASEKIKSFVYMVENQFEKKVKSIRSVNGPGFLMQEFYAERGILHQRRCVYTPHQNGRVERRQQHILNISRALMFQSKLPKKFWSYAVLHAIFLLNRIPTKILQTRSSHEVLYGQIPDLSQLKVFGCLSYASTLPINKHKFDPREKKCAFLGYKSGMKGYILVDVHNFEVFVSRNVKFFDLEFPFHSLSLNHVPNTHIYIDSRHDLSAKLLNDTEVCVQDTPSEDISEDDVVTDDTEQSNNANEDVESTPLRKSQRISKTPSRLQDYVCHSLAYPMKNYVSYSQLTQRHQAYALSISHDIEPSTFHLASQDSR